MACLLVVEAQFRFHRRFVCIEHCPRSIWLLRQGIELGKHPVRAVQRVHLFQRVAPERLIHLTHRAGLVPTEPQIHERPLHRAVQRERGPFQLGRVLQGVVQMSLSLRDLSFGESEVR